MKHPEWMTPQTPEPLATTLLRRVARASEMLLTIMLLAAVAESAAEITEAIDGAMVEGASQIMGRSAVPESLQEHVDHLLAAHRRQPVA